MSSQQNKTVTQINSDDIAVMEVLVQKISTLETFIARRFDEISMEINATSQQVDMAEDGITRRFAEILETLGAISYSGDGSSAANSGVELQAVIEDTEQAANTILDAADRISNYLDDEKNWSDFSERDSIKEKIKIDIQEILMACTFQDLTGQRIRNTLNNLHQIESRLSTTFERLGITVDVKKENVENAVRRASSQEDIDALLASMNEGNAGN